MTFENLPEDWLDESLTDPDLAMDAIDLFLYDSDRVRDSLLVLVCDDQDRCLQPVVINDIDWRMTAANRIALFTAIASFPVTSAVVAIAAHHAIDPAVADRWHRTAERELAQRGVELLGFYSADLFDVWDPRDQAA